MLNVGIDIDQTMFFLDVIEQASELTGLKYTSEDVKHWIFDKDTNGFPQWFVDIVFAHFDDSFYMGNLDINPGVVSKLNEWKSDGHKLHIISARRSIVRVETLKMLKGHFGEKLDGSMTQFFDSINFVDYKTDDKIKLFKKLQLDVWIDDNPKDIENAFNLNIKTFAICDKYTKYNRKVVNTLLKLQKDWCVKNLFVVKNFNEIKL